MERKNSSLFDELKIVRNESLEIKLDLFGSHDKRFNQNKFLVGEIGDIYKKEISCDIENDIKNDIKNENENDIKNENENRKDLIEIIFRNLKLVGSQSERVSEHPLLIR